MKHFTVLSALLLACVINPVSAADEHKGHDHSEKPAKAHAHEAKPRHGGVVSVVKDINYELVAKRYSLALYVTDHEQPVDTRNASGTITLLSASGRIDAQLLPAGGNLLRASGTFKIQPGTKAVAMVKLDEKSSQEVRFVLN